MTPGLVEFAQRQGGLSGEMALSIEKASGVRVETLMRMESAYDIAKTRSREKETHGIRGFGHVPVFIRQPGD